MEIYLLKKGYGQTALTGLTTALTISGEFRSCSRTLDFGIIHKEADRRTWILEINVGDLIKVTEAGSTIFYGIICTKDKKTDGKELDFSCQDFGIYLKRNKAHYMFKGITPEGVVKKVCGDFGIAAGQIAKSGKVISRNFLGVSLYDIIMTSYTIADDEKYYIEFQGEKLNIFKKGEITCPPISSEVNLLTAGVSESIANMVNRVRVYNKKDSLIQTIEKKEDVGLYGFSTEILKVTDTKEDYARKAKETLQGKERKISVTNLGGIGYKTGRKVIVTEPYTGLSGVFYIDGDEHRWKNGIYTNKLTLNFENLMDEKESGSNDKGR